MALHAKLADPSAADVLVAGAGLAGLTAAIAFGRAGFDVVACGMDERVAHGRTVAMLDRSIAYLDSLGLWAAVERAAAPLRALRLIDDTGALFPPRPVEFSASEIGLKAFGWNVENDRMADALAGAATATPGVERIGERIAAYDFSGERATALLEDGRRIAARLIVAADGRGSPARRAAGLPIRAHRYPQSALTTLVVHTRPHRDFSTEFHTREGPFTLVPLPMSVEGSDRSSLVWVMSDDQARRRATLDDATLAHEIERQARSMLGAIRIEGRRGVFPMVRQIAPKIAGPRVALIGDAAHAFPPIGAQGLNLGLRDVAAIVGVALEACAEDRDIGGAATLAAYDRSRRTDVFTRTVVVDGLNRALLSHFGPLDFARGAALSALGALAPLRRFVMREGVAPRAGRTGADARSRRPV